MVCELDASRDLSRVIVHVDMDAFYAAVEMRDLPELRDKPMAVGSMSMLVKANVIARMCVYVFHPQRHGASQTCSFFLFSVNIQLPCKEIWRSCCHARLHRQKTLPQSDHCPDQLR